MSEPASTSSSRTVGSDNKRLVDALNQLLEGEYIAMIHYVQHAGSVRGLNFPAVADWLRSQAVTQIDHAVALTRTILSLGGVPDWEVGRSHPFRASAEAVDVRRLLAHDLDHGRQLAAKYVDAIDLASQLGEVGVKVVLESMLAAGQLSMQTIERLTETP